MKEQEAIKPSAFALGVYLKLSFIIRFYFNICDRRLLSSNFCLRSSSLIIICIVFPGDWQ